MVNVSELETDRLLLRQWRQEDLVSFAELNADPEVMEYFPNTLTTSESNAMADKIERLILERGWGFWAVELKEKNNYIGFVGLHKPEVDLPFTPCVEIGWRLNKAYWGKGYATEAAKESLGFAFSDLGLSEVLSFTSVLNVRSQSVMQKIGMSNTHNNFEHPSLPVGHGLREHVLYKITKQQWHENA